MFKTVLLFNLAERLVNPDTKESALRFHAAYPSKSQQPELYKATEEFFKASPTGELKFSTVNEAIMPSMHRGKYYLVTVQEFDPDKPWQEQV